MQELHDLETYEVSFVPKGANGKQFLVFKNLVGEEGMKDAKDILDWITKNVDKDAMKRVEQVLKDGGAQLAAPHPGGGIDEPHMDIPLDDKTKAALQAIARIASPMKDSVHPGQLVKVLHAAGFDMKKGMDIFGNPDGEAHAADGEPPASLRDSSQPLQKDHMKAIPEDVLSDMKDVLKSNIESGKLDWREGEASLSPELEQSTMKSGDKGGDLLGGSQYGASTQKSGDDDDDDDDDIDVDDDADEMEKAVHKHMKGAYKAAKSAYKSYMSKLGYRKYPDVQPRMKCVSKDFKQVDINDIVHDDTEEKGMDVNKALDLSKVDPKLKPALEAIFKANREQVEKAARLERELKTERETRMDKELMDRAKAIGHGNIEKHFKIMKSLSAELRAEYESEQKSVAEKISKGGLFSEFGTSTQGTLPGNDAYAKIETIAAGMVEKSASKISKADAIDAVLKTEEGKRLYNEYMAAKPGMKV